METKVKGRAFVLGDNIDTDQIIPAEHLVYSLSDPEESKNYGAFALSGVPLKSAGLPDGGISFVNEGEYKSEYNIVIGGSNFGCGSSREHAPFAMMIAGTKVIIAESFARIFYRNCVDGGFAVPYETPGKLNDKINTGDELEVNFENNSVTNLTSDDTYFLKPLGNILPIIQAGNIFKYARQNNMM